MTAKSFSKVEAVADAWASIDGKLDKFRAANQTPQDGHRDGYMADAEELIKRLVARGWYLAKIKQ